MGAWCGENSVEMIYGGGHVGLMGIAADAALAAGGTVRGIIPRFLDDREVAHQRLDELILTETMHERQAEMARLAEGFVILPGGLGTLAEFFEIVTFKQLGLHDKPIVIINDGGFWDDLVRLLGVLETSGAIREDIEALVTVLPDFVTFTQWAQNWGQDAKSI